MIVGLIQPEHGSIFVDNNDITKKPIHVRSQLGLAYLPQESSIFKGLEIVFAALVCFHSLATSF